MKGLSFNEDLQARADKMAASRASAMKSQRDDIARKKSEGNQRDNVNKAKQELKKELGID